MSSTLLQRERKRFHTYVRCIKRTGLSLNKWTVSQVTSILIPGMLNLEKDFYGFYKYFHILSFYVFTLHTILFLTVNFHP